MEDFSEAYFVGDKIEVYAVDYLFDNDGSQLFDERGDSISVDYFEPVEIEDHFNSLNFIETWEYEGLNFSKPNRLISLCEGDTLVNGNLHTKAFIHFHTSENSIDSLCFKKDITYDICFYKQWENINDQKSVFRYGAVNKNLSSTALKSLDNYGTSQTEVYRFISTLITDANDGKLKIVSNLTEEEQKHLFEKATYVSKFDNLGDQQFDIQGNPVYEEAYVSYKFSDVAGIRFQEDWYLTSGRFGISKYVNAITFLINDYGKNNKIIGYKALPFKIVFDK